jgi:hypothetical protein
MNRDSGIQPPRAVRIREPTDEAPRTPRARGRPSADCLRGTESDPRTGRGPPGLREESVAQHFPQGSKRDWIQFPQSRAPGEIIRGGATHALACSIASGKRIRDFFKRLPDHRFRAIVGRYAVHREFIGANVATPLDQAPGLFGREVGRGQISLDQAQIV